MSAPTPAPPPAAAAAAIASSNPVLSYAKSALHTLVRTGGAEAAASLQDAFRLAEGDPAAQACLLNDMALCAMHESYAADAPRLLEMACNLLPREPLWAQRVRCQLMLNRCEAAVLLGQLPDAIRAAREAAELAQRALALTPVPAPRRSVRASRGATPKLFTARWLLPPEAAGDECAGTVEPAEGLLLAWLWCAVAQEAAGMYQESLNSMSHALAVAHVERGAAALFVVQLKKKVAASQLVQNDPVARLKPVEVKKVPLDAAAAVVAKVAGGDGGGANAAAHYAAAKSQAIKLAAQERAAPAPPPEEPAAFSSTSMERPPGSSPPRPSSALLASRVSSASSVRSNLSSLSISEARAPSDSAATKSAFAVYLCAHSERLRDAHKRDARLEKVAQKERARREREAIAREEEAALWMSWAAPEHLLADAAGHQLAGQTASREALLEAKQIAREQQELAAQRVAEGLERARKSQAEAARVRQRAARDALCRVLQALAGHGAGRAGAMRELRKLQQEEAAAGALRRARCLATASWLLEQPAAAQHATAVRMIETVLAEEQEEAAA